MTDTDALGLEDDEAKKRAAKRMAELYKVDSPDWSAWLSRGERELRIWKELTGEDIDL